MKKSSAPLSGPIALFSSVRLAIALLLMLAGTSILGTLIPQNKAVGEYLDAFGEEITRFLLLCDLHQMYTSWWFILLVVLLTLNILFCTITRLKTTLRIAFGKGFKGFSALPLQDEITLVTPKPLLEKEAKIALEKRFSWVQVLSTEKGITMDGEKGRWTRVGADVVHAGILILLAGALVGALFGFDGFVNIPEGERVDTITLRDGSKTIPLNFLVQCNTFSISHYDSGAVKEYRSNLTIIDNGRDVLTRDIIVNDPLTYKGITFYQASYGSLGAKEFSLRAVNRTTGKEVRSPVELGETLELGDGLRFTFNRFQSNYTFKGKSVGEAVVGTLSSSSKESEEVVLLTRFSNFDKMRKGEWVLSVEGHKHAYYTGLQVTQDPGVGLVYTGFLLMIAGCFIAFFMGPKKMRITLQTKGSETRIAIYGNAPKNPWWIRKQAQRILDGFTKSQVALSTTA
ncbi:MAG: cytochrome c biogenesis protein ResB [Desulfobacterales bacterium]|nr:cytochrome c biogenesis protein ResB [Desulfobacterales bacterium]